MAQIAQFGSTVLRHPVQRLGIESVRDVRGQYQIIDGLAATAGRYEGVQAGKAVPFLGVAAHRSLLFAGDQVGHHHEYGRGSQASVRSALCYAGATPAAR
jgi:hypothetical protein